MSIKTYEGRDVLTGRGVRVLVRSGVIDSFELIDDPAELPWISHGLVDLQINGFGGVDLNSADLTVEEVSQMTRMLAECGTSFWVPTIITQSHDHIAQILRTLALAVEQDPAVAAAIQCAHIEGPFISALDGPRGAHEKEFVRDISVEEVARWQEIFPIGYVTLSPHWDQAPRKISALRALGVHVAIGHTHADAKEVAAASVAGATLCTHLGNGMKAEIARHPNLLWEQIADRTLDAGLIADGHHLPAAVLETVVRAKGADNCFLVSDSVALAGSPPGRYTTPIGGDVILSQDGRLSLAHNEHLLAGAAVPLAHCVRFAAMQTQLAVSDVFAMATEIPGKILGEISGRGSVGVITAGKRANLVLWDAQFRPMEVINMASSAEVAQS